MIPRALGDALASGGSDGVHPGAWPLDEPAWEASRAALLDSLKGCQPPLGRSLRR